MANPTNERSEREFQADVKAAMAGTEDEIFQEALGDEPLDNDGDRSLEEMGEGLEGEALDEDEGEAGESEAEGEGESEEEAEGDEASEREEETAEGEPEEQPEPIAAQQRQQPQRREPVVPPSRLREETERARRAEDRERALERELSEMRGQLTQLTARVNAPAPKSAEETKPKPDMFSDPEGHERWVLEEAERRAAAKAEERFAQYRQEQQQQRDQFVNASVQRAATGERSWEFQAAYDAITKAIASGPRDNPIGTAIVQSPDPGKALFDWWDENGAEEYRARVAEQLGFVQQPQRQQGNGRQVIQQPRHVTRIPQSLRSQPPSLNGARGGGRQQIEDPELYDGSEESVFRYALK